MDQKTIMYVGAAAAAYYFFVHRKNQQGPISVRTDGGGIVPAAPSTVNREAAQEVARTLGLTQAAKNKRSVAAVMAIAGGRSLALGARKGVSVTALQQATVKAVQKSTPTKPPAKKGVFGKIASGVKSGGAKLTLVGKATVKPLAKASTAGVRLAARNPTLASAAATAVGGPGAGAATRAGLATYSKFQARR